LRRQVEQGFLEELADAEHPVERDGAWLKMVNYLDQLACSYIVWQARRIKVNRFGPVDDARLLELLEPYLHNEADRRVFVATCKRFVIEFHDLAES
jgi:hypothetical protein